MAFREDAFRVAETSATLGTGALTLGGALAGYKAVGDVLADGDTAPFLAVDSTAAWELFIGTYTASGNTLARTTRLTSSTGSAISFAAGKTVQLVFPGLAPLLQYSAQKATTVAADRVAVRDSVTGGLMYATLGALLPAESVLASRLALGDTSNAYPDPEMVDESAYSSAGGFTFQTVASDGGPSKKQLSVTAAAGVEVDVLSPSWPVAGSTALYVSCWGEVNGSGDSIGNLLIRWYSDVAASTEVSTEQVGTNVTSTAPAKKAGVVTAPSTAKRARMVFRKSAGSTGRSTVWSAPVARPLPALADLGGEPAIATGLGTDYWTGAKAWADFATAVRGAVLTGLSTATNAAIAATDTVLAAFGKLQAQVTALLGRSITAGNGMTGGGTLSADRTVTLGTPTTLTPSTTNAVTSTSHTHALNLDGIALNAASVTMPVGTVLTEYGAGDIATAVGGSTAGGTLLSGRTSGHIALVIQGNDDSDSVAVLSLDGGVYTRIFRLVRTGVAEVSNALKAPRLEGSVLFAQYTLATLPSASGQIGRCIEVTDATGGAKICRSDGTAWRILNTLTTVS